MDRHVLPHSSWRELLAAPDRGTHLLQIHDSDDFLAAGVAHFAGEGLARGEVAILNGTAEHIEAILRRLRDDGHDVAAAMERRQLVATDVREGMASIATAEAADIAALFDATLLAALQGGRYAGVRWWGEMAGLLCQAGETAQSTLLETVATESVRRHGASILCSVRNDRFDSAGYDALRAACCLHSHVIPAEDYVRHRLAVNHAIREVIGELRGSMLQSLSSWKGLACDLPSSQGLLFWVREFMPEQFEAVLARARAYLKNAESTA